MTEDENRSVMLGDQIKTKSYQFGHENETILGHVIDITFSGIQIKVDDPPESYPHEIFRCWDEFEIVKFYA